LERQTTRPVGVTIISILLGIHGVLALFAGLGAFGPYPGGFLGFALQLAYAAVLLILAYAMWTLQGWAWLVTLTFLWLDVVFTVLALFAAPGFWILWLFLILEGAVIAYLVQPSVSSRFTQ